MKSLLVVAVLGFCLGLTHAEPALAQETSEESDVEGTPAAGEVTQPEEEVTQEDLLETQDSVHGKRGRRLFKTAYWAAGLKGDMKEVYKAYGYPSSRYREEKVGIVLEKWTYLEEGRQFVFRGGKLSGTRRFNPGSAAGVYLE